MNRVEHGLSAKTLLTRGIAVAAALLACLVGLVTPALAQERPDKALGRPASASSVEQPRNGGGCNVRGTCDPGLANDGRTETRWSSEYTDSEFWQVDLGAARLVDTMALTWEPAYPERYLVSTSIDGVSFTPAAEQTLELTRAQWQILQVVRRIAQRTSFAPRAARYVRVTSIKRASKYGISIWDAQVFGPPDVTSPPPAAPVEGQAALGGPAPVAPVTPVTPFTSPEPSAPATVKPTPPAATLPRAPSSLRRLTPAPAVRIKGVATARGVQIELFSVRAPRAARIVVRCSGGGCPPRMRSRRGGLQRFRALQRGLKTGAVIETFITQRGTSGRYTRLRIRPNAAPRRTTGCVLYGSKRPARCPAT